MYGISHEQKKFVYFLYYIYKSRINLIQSNKRRHIGLKDFCNRLTFYKDVFIILNQRENMDILVNT